MSNAKYKIRRLMWRQEGNAWVADTSIASYSIIGKSRARMWCCVFGGMRVISDRVRSIREAKAACQEHFERKARVFLVKVKQ